LPELAPTEGNQQVAANRDKSLSPSVSTFCSQFAAIFRDLYFIFTTAILGRFVLT